MEIANTDLENIVQINIKSISNSEIYEMLL